ncbi:hypothetical protein K491DRAFT_696856 [Lophiostoma macrostomum CBS 122681]|uniref:SigF-like NTF2-like domain-containing protein n=1 Tax=Lophiostoma macrostomum CBS 122681 TaxID=1314788 RepID=A0A6A6ST60_9PLEO|nr:hypothetical protein K491DRAFT_696856 [Lophiostoma macrostomum CBS 122681]
MENPTKEIPEIIHTLTQSSPSKQHEAIETYFTSNAAFTHPLCRTSSWENSKFLIHSIYRWYKIMSPRIDLTINSVAFDEANLMLYVNMNQVFRIWIFPWYSAPVELTTVLKLVHNKGDGLYYIRSQNDLYQVDQWVQFIPFFLGARPIVLFLHALGTIASVICAYLFWFVTAAEERYAQDGGKAKNNDNEGSVDGIELQELERKSTVNSS